MKEAEKQICRKIFYNINNEEISKNMIRYIYDLTHTEYINCMKCIPLIENVDDIFFIINLAKMFLYIVEYIRLFDIPNKCVLSNYIERLENNKDYLNYSDDLFISNVILLLKSMILLHTTFANSFILSKQNEKLEASFEHSKISMSMKNNYPICFSLNAENVKTRAQITSDFNLKNMCTFDEITVVVDNEIQIKNKKSNYQMNLKLPHLTLKGLLHGNLSFTFSDKLVVRDSLRNCADIRV